MFQHSFVKVINDHCAISLEVDKTPQELVSEEHTEMKGA